MLKKGGKTGTSGYDGPGFQRLPVDGVRQVLEMKNKN
jgi:hypothetical protein